MLLLGHGLLFWRLRSQRSSNCAAALRRGREVFGLASFPRKGNHAVVPPRTAKRLRLIAFSAAEPKGSVVAAVQLEGISMSIKFAAIAAAFACMLLIGAPRLLAHEGHDHETAAPPASSGSPRAEATSPAFELVAVRQGAELEIWLDRSDTNEPVGGAIIDVETPTGLATAVEAQNGAYRIPAPWASAAGRYDLIFTVTNKGDADVLTATLVVPDRSPAKTGSLAGSKLGTFEGATTLIVAVASLVFGAFSALTLRKRPISIAPSSKGTIVRRVRPSSGGCRARCSGTLSAAEYNVAAPSPVTP
jgi:hypothetical protein